MKETKNVPQLRFSGFDDNWKEVIFSEIFTERHDISTITKNYPQLSFTIAEGVIRPEDRKTNQRDFLIKDKENKQYLKTELNDIIYNPANVVFGAIHRNGLGNGVLSPIYKIFYTNEDSVFLEGIVRNPEFIKKIANQTEGTVTKLKTLKPENFLQMRSFISPYLQEQQKIGTFLSHVDSLIQAKTKKLESLKAIKKSLLQKCFPKAGEKVPEMRFAGFSGDWEEKEFIELVSRESKTNISDENNPCVEYEDVTPEIGILNNDVYKKKVRKTGISFDNKNILYGKLRPYLHNWLKPNFEGVAVGDWWVLEPNNVDRDFLYRLIQTKEFDDIANQSSGSKMPRADWNLISHSTFSVPMNIEEQQKIGQFFSKYDSLICAQQKEIDKLKGIKKSLLQKMFV